MFVEIESKAGQHITLTQLIQEADLVEEKENEPLIDVLEAEPTDLELVTLADEIDLDVIDTENEDYLAHIDADDTVRLYIAEASRHPLLTKEEEIQLAQQTEQGRLAQKKFEKEKKTNSLNPAIQKELEIAIDDGSTAVERMICSNTRLVVSVAKKYTGRAGSLLFLDLIQEGNMGLMKAVDKFDWKRGNKFSTYATWWIRAGITRAIENDARSLRLPVSVGYDVHKVQDAKDALDHQLGRPPSLEELAEKVSMTSKKVKTTLKLGEIGKKPARLDVPVGEDDDDAVLGDFLTDEELPPEDQTTYRLLQEQIRGVLQDLPEKEQRVLMLRFGLEDGQAYTLREVGELLDRSYESIRKTERDALAKLRQPDIQNKLYEYLDK